MIPSTLPISYANQTMPLGIVLVHKGPSSVYVLPFVVLLDHILVVLPCKPLPLDSHAKMYFLHQIVAVTSLD